MRDRTKYHEEYCKKNREAINARASVFYHENKERINKKSKDKRAKETKQETELRRALNRRAFKHKMTTEPMFKLKKNLVSRMCMAFKRRGSKLPKPSKEILGAEYENIKKHIENQFTNGMDWSSYGNGRGKWNLDHIIPLASAKDNTELIELCHYTNIRPLWFIQNIRKGAKTED